VANVLPGGSGRTLGISERRARRIPGTVAGQHRTVNQGLLDLKRLYWNTHRFRKGRRRGKCTYQLLKLELPSYDCWEILQCEMAQGPTQSDAQPMCQAALY